MAFNGDDAREAQFNGTLTDTAGSGTTLSVAFSEMKDGFSFTSGNTDGSLIVKVEKGADNSTNSSLVATANEKELARITSTLRRE